MANMVKKSITAFWKDWVSFEDWANNSPKRGKFKGYFVRQSSPKGIWVSLYWK